MINTEYMGVFAETFPKRGYLGQLILVWCVVLWSWNFASELVFLLPSENNFWIAKSRSFWSVLVGARIWKPIRGRSGIPEILHFGISVTRTLWAIVLRYFWPKLRLQFAFLVEKTAIIDVERKRRGFWNTLEIFGNSGKFSNSSLRQMFVWFTGVRLLWEISCEHSTSVLWKADKKETE